MAKDKEIAGSLDTNILVRIVLGDVPSQIDKIEKLLSSGGVYAISDHAIFELVFVLEKYYGIPRKEVNVNIQNIIKNPIFDTNTAFLTDIMIAYLQYPKLSVIDCALAIQAKEQHKLPFYTFDKALVKNMPGIVKVPTEL